MPTRPPPERRFSGSGNAPGHLIWLVPVLFAALVVLQIAITPKRHEARLSQWCSNQLKVIAR